MKANDLKSLSTQKNRKRVGRGISAGQGKTAGRGTKGQNSRTGGGVRLGFEGGQNPLVKRIPKMKGFKNNRNIKAEVTTKQLEKISGSTVNNKVLAEAKLVPNEYLNVKLILSGEVKKKYSVSLQGISKSAEDAIVKAGGSFKKVPRPSKQAKSSEK